MLLILYNLCVKWAYVRRRDMGQTDFSKKMSSVILGSSHHIDVCSDVCSGSGNMSSIFIYANELDNELK